MYLCFRTTFLLASISPDIRESKSALTRSKWTLSRMVRHFSVLQSALPTVHISLVPLNHLPSPPTGSPPFLLLELPFGNPNDYARSGHLHSTATVPESSSSLSYLHCITYDESCLLSQRFRG